jgi:hypothetical protein
MIPSTRLNPVVGRLGFVLLLALPCLAGCVARPDLPNTIEPHTAAAEMSDALRLLDIGVADVDAKNTENEIGRAHV